MKLAVPVAFSPDGRLVAVGKGPGRLDLKAAGTRGNGNLQFNTPHTIASDAKGNIYVGDRGNRRVQVFDTDGNFLRQWTVNVAPDFNTRAVNGATPAPGSISGVGAPNSLCIPPGQGNVMFLGESTWPGRVFKITAGATSISDLIIENGNANRDADA